MAPPKKPRVKHRVEFALGRAVLAVLGALPFGAARAGGRWLGRLGYRLGARRVVVERQVAAAFPELDDAARGRIVRESYANLGEVMVEVAMLPKLGPRGILDLVAETHGFEAVLEAHAAGKGLLLITGHLGNYELAGTYVSARGVPNECIVRRLNNPLFDAYVTKSRTRAGMIVVFDHDGVRRIPRAFAAGHAVSFVADQGVKGLASSYVPFFGRPAKTPRGPAVYALRTGLPTFFVVAVRRPDGKYRLDVTPVTVRDTGDREADVEATVAEYTRILESWVRRHPGQYFWHHRRWKRQPPDTPDELRDPVVALATEIRA